MHRVVLLGAVTVDVRLRARSRRSSTHERKDDFTMNRAIQIPVRAARLRRLAGAGAAARRLGTGLREEAYCWTAAAPTPRSRSASTTRRTSCRSRRQRGRRPSAAMSTTTTSAPTGCSPTGTTSETKRAAGSARPPARCPTAARSRSGSPRCAPTARHRRRSSRTSRAAASIT